MSPTHAILTATGLWMLFAWWGMDARVVRLEARVSYLERLHCADDPDGLAESEVCQWEK